VQLYYFPSPNPQKVKFALLELGLECEMTPVDLSKREQREPGFLAVNPFGRVPVLVDGDLVLWESHAILAYLSDYGLPRRPGGRDALRWLFFLTGHIGPPTGELALRIRAKIFGIPTDEATIARGEKALPDVIKIVEAQLSKNKWLPGPEFSLVDCAYCPILNVIEKAGFSFAGFPRVNAYLDTIRSRRAWQETPRLPDL
jgi:glutathione S-transferase